MIKNAVKSITEYLDKNKSNEKLLEQKEELQKKCKEYGEECWYYRHDISSLYCDYSSIKKYKKYNRLHQNAQNRLNSIEQELAKRDKEHSLEN